MYEESNGTNRKLVYDFLLVGHCDYGPILHRFWDTVTYWLKIAYFATFFIPLSHLAPSLPMFPLKFQNEVNREETRVVSNFDMIPDCDRQMDRPTESIIASTAFCIASRILAGFEQERYRGISLL